MGEETMAKVPRHYLDAMFMHRDTLIRFQSGLLAEGKKQPLPDDLGARLDQVTMLIPDFRGLRLDSWEKRVVCGCYCHIARQNTSEVRPFILLNNRSALYEEVLEKDRRGRFRGRERQLVNQALRKLQQTVQQIVFIGQVGGRRKIVAVQAPLIREISYSFVPPDGCGTVRSTLAKGKILIEFHPVIFKGLVDNWRLIPKNLSKEIHQVCPDIPKVTALMEDFILFLHKHSSRTAEVRRRRSTLAKELKIEPQYLKNPKRTNESLCRAFETARRTGYLTEYRLDQQGWDGLVDVFLLNPAKFEHLKRRLESRPTSGEISPLSGGNAPSLGESQELTL